jgi:hypothetical protein
MSSTSTPLATSTAYTKLVKRGIGADNAAKLLTTNLTAFARYDIRDAQTPTQVANIIRKTTVPNVLDSIVRVFTDFKMFSTHVILFDEVQLVSEKLQAGLQRDGVRCGTLKELDLDVPGFNHLTQGMHQLWNKKGPTDLILVHRREGVLQDEGITFETRRLEFTPFST